MRRKKAALNLAVNFLVIIVIAIVVFSFSIFLVKRFFTHAEMIKMTYDERTEREIERLLDDGSRVAVPFDKKTIGNGESKTFGVGILNMLNMDPVLFNVSIKFNKAYDQGNIEICPPPSSCAPDTWLQTITSSGVPEGGVSIMKEIKNNEQEKFLLMVEPRNAPSGTYIFDLSVTYRNQTSPPNWLQYDTLHKLYVDVP